MKNHKEIFERHFAYELWMLLETRELLIKPSHNRIIWNALIESFCVHARGLMLFLEGEDIELSEFLMGPYSFKRDEAVGTLIRKINKQVAHVTYERTVDISEKITQEAREDLFRQVLAEVERFKTHLKPEYEALWPQNIRPPYRIAPARPLSFEASTTSTGPVVVGWPPRDWT